MITTAQVPAARPAVARRRGAPLLGPAVVSVALFMLSVLIGVLFAGKLYASPFADDHTVQRYFVDHPTMVGFIGLLQLGSAIALAVFTGAVCGRMRALAPAASGYVSMAAVGGAIAATLLAVNGVVQWALSRTATGDPLSLLRTMNYLFFGLGGPAHVAALGVLIAGICLPATGMGLVPRWFGIASLVVALLAVLSLVTLIRPEATVFIPLGRFPTLLWLVAVSVLLSRARVPREGRGPRAEPGGGHADGSAVSRDL
ncbi:MAG TPA: hypothetical protein VH352_13765 [Pseudonocardiaceae bacterium]|jgi:hypothetical protein|nr:hypothetical protein [Pseudonocardiaceae bacterium]